MQNGEAAIFQINVSNGGVPKRPVPRARVTVDGVEGDRHNSPMHGGPERAVCIYALEIIERVQAEGHPIAPGSAGENVTTVGLDFAGLAPGDRLQLGDELLVEITRYTTPCKTIAASFLNGDFSRIAHKDHPGESRVYARVLQPGTIRVGDPIRVVPPTDGQGT